MKVFEKMTNKEGVTAKTDNKTTLTGLIVSGRCVETFSSKALLLVAGLYVLLSLNLARGDTVEVWKTRCLQQYLPYIQNSNTPSHLPGERPLALSVPLQRNHHFFFFFLCASTPRPFVAQPSLLLLPCLILLLSHL